MAKSNFVFIKSKGNKKPTRQLNNEPIIGRIFKKGDRVIYDNPETTKLGTLGKVTGTKGEYYAIKLDTGETVKTHATFVKKPLTTLRGKKQWR